jgi:acyl dehydratase
VDHGEAQTIEPAPRVLATAPTWFEDFSVGMEFISPERTIGDDDVRAYVRFSNDVRPLLGNVRGAPLRVPDMYLFSLSIGLLLHGDAGYIPARFVAFFGFPSINFVAAAHAGDSVHSVARVTHTVERGRNGVVTYEHEARGADGAALVTSTQLILVERRGLR